MFVCACVFLSDLTQSEATEEKRRKFFQKRTGSDAMSRTWKLFPLSLGACVCVRVCLGVCACVWGRKRERDSRKLTLRRSNQWILWWMILKDKEWESNLNTNHVLFSLFSFFTLSSFYFWGFFNVKTYVSKPLEMQNKFLYIKN